MSGSALFEAGLARSSAQFASVLTSVRYPLLVSKLNVISADQIDSEFGSAQLGAQLGSAWFGSHIWLGSALS